MEPNGLSSFGRQSPKEHSCIIISKLMHWLRRRSPLKVFLVKVVKSIFLFIALVAILFNIAEFFEQFW